MGPSGNWGPFVSDQKEAGRWKLPGLEVLTSALKNKSDNALKRPAWGRAFSLLKPHVWKALVHKRHLEERAWAFALCRHSCFGTNSPRKSFNCPGGQGQRTPSTSWCPTAGAADVPSEAGRVGRGCGLLGLPGPSVPFHLEHTTLSVCLPMPARAGDTQGGLGSSLPGPFLSRASITCLRQRVPCDS